MGWFDDSDSDEDVKSRKRPLETFNIGADPNVLESSFSSATFTSTQVDVEEKYVIQPQHETNKAKAPGMHDESSHGEDEDPLDSYMKGLSSSAAETKVRGRLDVENEEEATAHWQADDAAAAAASSENYTLDESLRPSKGKQERDTGEGDNTIRYTYESMTAKAAMASTFHKAGEARHAHKIDSEAASNLDLNHEREKNRTIDPLEQINHSSIVYAPFKKQFHEPLHSQFGSSWRRENEVSCSIDIDPILSFDQYGPSSTNEHGIFASEILGYLHKNDFRQTTLVQSQSIPAALAGHDLLVTSHTGSGKTLAYILPLVTHVLDQPHIVPNVDGPIAIVLAPTRELAKQVHLVAKKVLQVVGGKVVAVTGGSGTYEMSKELKKGCELIVSTPGRLIDMIKRKATNCERVTFVVLDEADKMLEMGFETQCASILNSIRPGRQTVMFSATFGKRVERAAKGWLRNPVRIAVGRTGTSSEHVDQHVLVLPSYDAKLTWLLEMLPILADVGKMIIFVASRADCEAVTRKITGKGLSVDSIHGDKHQSDRTAALSALRKGTIDALVATDVAARGLDVADIMTVINFDPAKNLDSHVHRIGRAGRLNKDASESGEHKRGNGYTLLTPRNADFANSLMEAFQREGREVSDELLQLSMKSRHNGGGGRQQQRDSSGLGYYQASGTNTDPHHQKKSRWK